MIKGRAESELEVALIELEYAMAEWKMEYASLQPADESQDAKRWRNKVIAANLALEIARLLLNACSTRSAETTGARHN